MRSRLQLPQLVTVRPLVVQATDAFGDSPVIAPRSRSFTVRMVVSWMTRATSESGSPGRESRETATGLVTKELCEQNSWIPSPDDIVETADGSVLFVRDAQPDDPKPIRLGSPSGSWGLWRLSLTNSAPERRGATSYD